LNEADRGALFTAAASRGVTPEEWLSCLASAHLRKAPQWSRREARDIASIASAVQQIADLLHGIEAEEAVSVARRLYVNLSHRLDTMMTTRCAYWGIAA
jgi:hypothetical protein